LAGYCIAVDIGASSGRLIAGRLDKGRLELQEIHRFENNLVQKDGQFCWDISRIFKEIKTGVHQCREMGIVPASIGIDTWAVDFVLLDGDGQPLTEAISYRDPRTDGMMEEVFSIIPREKLYMETGIQFQKFNTIYQLFSLKRSSPELLEKAKTFLMIPDFLNYLLTGIKANEYTNATSTQLVNAFTKSWDDSLLIELGISRDLFQDIKAPKTILGTLTEELVSEFGFDMKVILPATHDTGSAVISVPETEETIYISSGTWSLMGVENHFPICVPKAEESNFTNEGGVDYQYRFLKNIMGLWMIQEVKRNYKDEYSFAQLVEMARNAREFSAIVNVNDGRFLKPDDMIGEIQNYCLEAGQAVPSSPGEVAKCVFDSLAAGYKEAAGQLEEIFEREFSKINVIGGGSQNEMLNQLISNATGKPVYAGPVEATAIGNIAVQLMALGEIRDIREARQIIRNSFDVKKYTPEHELVN
jgi:rhamnulokinase